MYFFLHFLYNTKQMRAGPLLCDMKLKYNNICYLGTLMYLCLFPCLQCVSCLGMPFLTSCRCV